MVDRRDELESCHVYLREHGAGFLRNTLRIPETTCSVCTGIPKPGFSSCYSCGHLHDPRQLDRLGFVTYAWHPHQSGTVMRGYKAPQPAPANRALAQVLLIYAIVGHWSCMNDPWLGPPTAWAVVPSFPAKPTAQPLMALAADICNFPKVELRASDPAVGRPRDFEPANFQAAPTTGNVLLIDDTWATGGHIQSAGAALKNAGASRVTGLLLARWLEPGWSYTKDFIERELTTDFDPDLCPFTGQTC